MKVAIMQPYLFPYIGYFQLINAVDTFVLYDDVNFIKSGWIHRNRILVNGKAMYFTVPLVKQSSFIAINDTEINQKFFENWKVKFFKSLKIGYSRAPYFEENYNLIKEVFETRHDTISSLAISSLKVVAKYLSIETKFEISSEKYIDTFGLEKVGRLIKICQEKHAEIYINLIGGKSLYDKETFFKSSIELMFIKNEISEYRQFQHDFISGLSIIDVLMFNSVEDVKVMLDQYELI